MYIISSFDYSIYLELAISQLEEKGVLREKIFAIPLNKRNEEIKLFDSLHQSDGVSLFDVAIILGTIGMIFGVIYGYVLAWGSIIWGLIGLFAGGIIGFLIDIIPKRKLSSNNRTKYGTAEVFLLVQCDKSQADMIEKILWDNMAFGIAKLDE